MKKILLSLIILSSSIRGYSQTTLASWTFEGVTCNTAAATQPTVSAGSLNADAGINSANAISTCALSTHAAATTVWSNPSGNGSVKSLSSNGWTVNDYYQFSTSTTGFSGITLKFDHNGSSTGPRDWKVQYSTDGSTFTDVVGATYAIPVATWAAATPITTTSFSYDLSSITNLNNKSSVFIRIVDVGTVSINGTGTVAATSTSRMDNFSFIASATTTLPISLTSFTGKAVDKNILLSWNTASEINNNYFEVKHSSDGKTFTTIGKVNGAGNSSTAKDYSFADENPAAGTNYYQLIQHDFDGKTSSSAIIGVDSKIDAAQLSVYASSSDVKISISSPNQSKGFIQLFDLSGRKLAEQAITVNKGFNNITLPVSLPTGIHFARYTTEGVVINQKFAK